MAEIILTPLAELIIGKLASYAFDQVLLLWTLKPEILKLQDTVTSIQAVLLDAEQKQSHNNQVKLWLERLSDFMYDADDLLDDFSTEAALRRRAVAGRRTGMAATCWSSVCSLVSSRPKQLMYDYKMARGIKAIREKLDEISEDRKKYNLEVLTEVALASRETDSCPPTIVVGREDDKKNIIQLLLNFNQEANISLVPIVGLGGLGKTTLAQLVFDDDQVQAHFDIKAWVYVSQSFDVKVILGKMLRSIDLRCRADLELNDLQTQLREKIKEKKFLFVLDDVWEETNQSWETLGKYLVVGALGSKVLMTTRSTTVAKVGGGALKSRTSIVESYYLKGLSEEESWKLLVEKYLPREVPQEPEVQKIGKQILKKCGGIPLVVSTVVGVLVDSSNPKIEWQSFLDKRILSIRKEGEEDLTMSTLRLSFNHLSSRMKHCFTYCKLFPKGSRIDIKQLLLFWIAQGYVESEDKGLSCFQILWWRSFFQEVEMDELGNMSTCRMHDMMHDLVDTVAGENIIRSSSLTMLQNIPSKTRHLMIGHDDRDNSREEDYGDDMRNESKLRSLICYLSLSREELKKVLNNCLRLRSLVITNEDLVSGGEENSILDASVDKLKHLRYFGFNCTGKRKIPDSVTNLINLQVLQLFGRVSLEELPRGIGKLVNLKHFLVDPDAFKQLTHMPKGIGKLQFLQRLPVFVVGEKSSSSPDDRVVGAGLDELEGLNALSGELTINGLANVDSLIGGVYVLKKKLYLESLVLDWGLRDDNHDDITPLSSHDEATLEMLWPHPNLKKLIIRQYNEGMKLSNWLSSLTNLVEFSLQDCKQCEYLPPQMHQMFSLKKLTIMRCPTLKGIGNNGDHSDPYRDNLTTKRLTMEEEDEDWPRFHRLSYLRTQDCPRLTRLPLFPTVEGELEVFGALFASFARTMKMKMRRGGEGEGGVDYSGDANIHAVSSSSSSTLVYPTLSKLTNLTLSDIDDDLESLSYRDLSSCLVSLQELTVRRCNRAVKLPGSLCSSIYLTEIHIIDCRVVEYLPPIHELPSLRELTIVNCPELKGCWWKKTKKKKQGNSNTDDYYNFDPYSLEGDEQEKEEEETEDEWPHFPCLFTLQILCCPKLTRMPLFPTVEGWLKLSETSAEALVRTMKMKVVAALVTPPLSDVIGLSLWDMKDLESLPEEGLRNLASLQQLWIRECPRLASLPPAMQHLTHLQELYIIDCPVLRERCRKGDSEDWPNIFHIPKIELDWVKIS